MYALVKNNKLIKYPYSLGEFSQENPQVSLPEVISDALMSELGFVSVEQTEPPAHDPDTQYLTEGNPKKDLAGKWNKTWTINNYSDTELAQRQYNRIELATQQRAYAYREEADPLFFMAQRGDATVDQWLAKVQEIKRRYPK